MSKLILKAIPANATSAAAEQTLGFIDTTGGTQRVSVKAQPKMVYRLVDAKTGEVIKNQTVVRKGKKLQVMVDIGGDFLLIYRGSMILASQAVRGLAFGRNT